MVFFHIGCFMRKILFFTVLLIFCGKVFAEYPPSEVVFHKFLKYSESYLPKELLSTKTVVIVYTATDPETGLLSPWKDIATEAHEYMRSLGVDPVKYYHTTEISAGPDVRRAIASELAEREIANLVMLAHMPEQGEFVMIITGFSGDAEFVENSQDAWYTTAATMNLLFRELARTIDGSDVVQENLLIIDEPEYMRRPEIIRGRRNVRYNTDLRIDKLAIPLFDSIPVPQNIPAGEINLQFARDIEQLNTGNAGRNRVLETMFAQYPYEYGLVQYDFDEQSMRNVNYQCILMMLHGTAESIRAYLEYPEEDDDTQSLRAVHTNAEGSTREIDLAHDQTVFKVYVKHIYTGDVYLGDVWDAAPTWQQALQVHLNRMLLQLK
jgi:hypothetical protein